MIRVVELLPLNVVNGIDMNEAEMANQLEKLEANLIETRLKFNRLKNKMIEAESELIGIKLQRDQLNEKLKKLRSSLIQEESDPYEADNKRFLAAMPELLKKL